MPRLSGKFASTMTASQRGQVAALLQEGTSNGEFSNDDALKTKLEELSILVETSSIPFLTFFQVHSFEIVDSSRLNQEFRYMRLDMETIYTELSAIKDTLDGHYELFQRKVEDFQNVIATLDNEIDTLELLNESGDFSIGWLNTFDLIGSDNLSRSASNAERLYTEPRSATYLDPVYDMVVDVSKQGLVLPTLGNSLIPIVSVQVLEGETTTHSDLPILPSNISIENLLVDGDTKYWVHPVLLLAEDPFHNPKSPPSNGVTAALYVELGGLVGINSLTISPWTDSVIYIDQIQYKAEDGIWYDLLESSFALTDRATIVFSRVTTSGLIISLRDKTYTELTSFFYSSDPVSTETLREVSFHVTANNVSLGNSTTLYSRGYLYTIGLDYLSVADINFRELGIYVSRPYITQGEVTELAFRNTVTHVENSVGLLKDTVEYSIVKYNYYGNGGILYTEEFPVTTGTSIEHEALIPNTSGEGKLRFFPVYGSIILYRDGDALTLGTDYELSVDKRSTWVTNPATTPVGPPIELWIRIIDYLRASNYTVSYTIAIEHPTLADTPIWLTENNSSKQGADSIQFLVPVGVASPAYSVMYLRIVTRSYDLLSTRHTPVIQEYKLLASEH